MPIHHVNLIFLQVFNQTLSDGGKVITSHFKLGGVLTLSLSVCLTAPVCLSRPFKSLLLDSDFCMLVLGTAGVNRFNYQEIQLSLKSMALGQRLHF